MRDRALNLLHRASSNIQNNIAKESARVCFAQLQKSLIASSKDASSVYLCLRAYRHFWHYTNTINNYLAPVLVPSDLFTRGIPSVKRPGFLPNISSWSRCDNFILKIKNPCFPVQESNSISQSNLLAVRKHWLNFHSTQFKGQRVVFHPTLLCSTQTRKLNQDFHTWRQSLNSLPCICTLTCTHSLSQFLQNSLIFPWKKQNSKTEELCKILWLQKQTKKPSTSTKS